MAPLGVIRPIWLLSPSVNQRLPSGPLVMALSQRLVVGIWKLWATASDEGVTIGLGVVAARA
jgi:hypothetical protein